MPTGGASLESGGVRVLHKTLDILECLKTSDTGLKLADLARAVELPKATVYRILSTLETRGFLDRGTDGAYRMGKKMFDLQRTESIEQLLTRVAQPVMQQLAEATKETINLGILDAGEVAVINTVESPLAVRMSSKIGNRRHLHSTALGKVLLAGLPQKEFLRLIRRKPRPKLTSTTITSLEAISAEIARVRSQNWAMDNQENEIDGRCIGAPITDATGRVIAALSVSGPEFRMDIARARKMVPQLTAACAEISKSARSS